MINRILNMEEDFINIFQKRFYNNINAVNLNFDIDNIVLNNKGNVITNCENSIIIHKGDTPNIIFKFKIERIENNRSYLELYNFSNSEIKFKITDGKNFLDKFIIGSNKNYIEIKLNESDTINFSGKFDAEAEITKYNSDETVFEKLTLKLKNFIFIR